MFVQARQRGRMRCHCMQNVQTALDFLKRKGVGTVICMFSVAF